MNFRAVLTLPKTAGSAQTQKYEFHLNCLEYLVYITLPLSCICPWVAPVVAWSLQALLNVSELSMELELVYLLLYTRAVRKFCKSFTVILKKPRTSAFVPLHCTKCAVHQYKCKIKLQSFCIFLSSYFKVFLNNTSSNLDKKA